MRWIEVEIVEKIYPLLARCVVSLAFRHMFFFLFILLIMSEMPPKKKPLKQSSGETTTTKGTKKLKKHGFRIPGKKEYMYQT